MFLDERLEDSPETADGQSVPELGDSSAAIFNLGLAYLAVDTKSVSSPPISSSCSIVRASPVDCRPITTH